MRSMPTHPVMRLAALFTIVGILWTSGLAEACVYRTLVRNYNRAVERWLDDPSPSRLALLCFFRNKMINKGFGPPDKPIPPVPPGGVCTPDPGAGGRGRGGAGGGKPGGGGGMGGPAGAIFPPGTGPFPITIFIRNYNDIPCEFDWTITPDAGNPPGFGLSATMGTELVPPGTTVTVTVDATIGGGVTPGTEAEFDVEIIDDCNGLPVSPDFSVFKVTATSDISIVPMPAVAFAADGVPFSLAWEVTNHTPAPIVKSFGFEWSGDPVSVAELNDGTPYDVRNIFLADGLSASSGGSISLGPFESEIIPWEPLENGEFCDPNMIGCCGLEIDGNVSCVMVANEDLGPSRTPERFDDLVGEATGGMVGLDITNPDGNWVVQVPTFPAQPITQILDGLALQTLNLADNALNFKFMPKVDERGFALMASDDTQVFPFSNDPGLFWDSHNIGPVSGLGPTGQFHQVQMQLLQNGQPQPGVPINFQVDGANPNGGVRVTNPQGVATYQYFGNNAGADFISSAVGFSVAGGVGPRPFALTTREWEGVTAIEDAPVAVVTSVELHEAEPNPFNPSTRIGFTLPDIAAVELSIFAADGRAVRTLVRDYLEAGEHAFEWDGRDATGELLSSGVYFYRLTADGDVHTRKLVMLK